MAKKASGHGGSREGAGRPALVLERKRVTFDLEQRDHDALAEIASSRRTSLSILLREIVTRYLRRAQQRGRE